MKSVTNHIQTSKGGGGCCCCGDDGDDEYDRTEEKAQI